MTDATFNPQTELEASEPTLVEGLPGTGLVASIAVDHVTDHLGLDKYGTIRSDAFPSVASFTDGLVQDTVRVYAGTDPDILTLQSDVPIPPEAYPALNECVLDELSESFGRAIFLAGAPAESEEDHGTVSAVGTTQAVKADLDDAGLNLAEEAGAVGGVTGSLVTACYHADLPAVLLLVRADPRMPDPGAAHSVIERGLEPLVDFEIDTSQLVEQAEEIQERKQQIVQQLRQQQEQETTEQAKAMYQ